jgi:hypothetical protein
MEKLTIESWPSARMQKKAGAERKAAEPNLRTQMIKEMKEK